MKKLISSIVFALIALVSQAQILTPVKWKIKLDDKDGSPEKEIVFTATSDNGWHLYDMNLPEGGPVSTSFTFETLKGAELVGEPVPSIKPTTVYDEQFAMDLRWYPGTVSFVQKIRISDSNKFKAEGVVEFMACNDETCLPPDQIQFAFSKKDIHVDNAMAAAGTNINAKEDEVAETVDAVETKDEPVATVVKEKKAVEASTAVSDEKAAMPGKITDAPELWAPVIDKLKNFGDSTITATDTSWLFIFFAGFLGGLIALLTPCVWPMIPMTVSFFLKRTKDRKKAIRDAVTYGISIIVIYLVMGLLITGIFGASALNDLSTNAVFNILFFLLLV
ncbi:thiol:disulfide interchange protein DsbD, partial [gut metagenome]